MNVFNVESLIATPACLKTSLKSNNPSYIDLIISNKEFFKKSFNVEVGISDHRYLVTTILKRKFIKGNPKIKFYRDYEKFDLEKFRAKLFLSIDKKEVYCYSSFNETYTSLFHKYAPINKKILRYDNNSYMTKMLRKAIMLRSKLKNKYNENRSTENWDNYKQQRNFFVSLFHNQGLT